MEAMNTYYVGGTVGDSYITLCKLYSIAIKEPILCRHFNGMCEKSVCEKLQPTIREVYELLPNIKLEFLNKQSLDLGISGNFESSCLEKERNRYNLKQPEYYPKFELGDIGYLDLPKTYVTLQIKAGSHGYGNRSLAADRIRKVLEDSKLPIVIIGERTIDLPTEDFDILDLRDNTTIKEVINIIKNSKHFYGLLGFLSFVACSHKVMSSLWIKLSMDIKAVKFRQEAVEEWNKFLIKKEI